MGVRPDDAVKINALGEAGIIIAFKGFDPTAVPDSHLGIAGMRARAAKIGAQLECISEPGRGTTIEVVVPDEVVERFPASSRPTAPTPTVR